MPPSRVTVEQSKQVPFCVFRTGRQDCGVPLGQEPLWRIFRPKVAKFALDAQARDTTQPAGYASSAVGPGDE
jgi:hypothetical protein